MKTSTRTALYVLGGVVAVGGIGGVIYLATRPKTPTAPALSVPGPTQTQTTIATPTATPQTSAQVAQQQQQQVPQAQVVPPEIVKLKNLSQII